ncbi:DUF401 family protein [Thermanaerosceptrum fracticalcis]|uniref:DUF401 family protein n=1 Tax=Thermanaerosceptrum fracticalcis TaxID=1712410 RepID=A0A7G6E6C5_THEFR|nr:DUF401 family protein [Thermanaerosceptrum fracticalcis]QNB47629.1 DUF401 family protein [Thermanaerosceptrum fracticalcis]
MADTIKLFITISVLVLLTRKKFNIGFSMMLAGILLTLLYVLAPYHILQIFYQSLTSPDTLELLFSLIFILILEHILTENDLIQKITGSMAVIIRDPRKNMAALAALVGTLPAPGGARFSCPMVREVNKALNMSPEDQSFINYWFRHVVEYFWPIYPAVLLTASMQKISVNILVLCLIPVGILSLVVGFKSGFKNISKPVIERKNITFQDLKLLLIHLLPFMIVGLLVFTGVKVPFALFITVAILMVLYKYNLTRALGALKAGMELNTILLVIGVMFFKQVIITTGSVERIPELSYVLGIPVWLILLIIPWFIGMVNGMASPTVVIAFSILGEMVGQGIPNLGYILLVFLSSFAGTRLSPAHLCILLTTEYFGSDYSKLFKRSLIPELVVLLFSVMWSSMIQYSIPWLKDII